MEKSVYTTGLLGLALMVSTTLLFAVKATPLTLPDAKVFWVIGLVALVYAVLVQQFVKEQGKALTVTTQMARGVLFVASGFLAYTVGTPYDVVILCVLAIALNIGFSVFLLIMLLLWGVALNTEMTYNAVVTRACWIMGAVYLLFALVSLMSAIIPECAPDNGSKT